MLKSMLKLVENTISKKPIDLKVFLNKFFEFVLCDYIVSLKVTLALILLLNYYSVDKFKGKKDLIWLISLSGFKIVFT